MDSEHYAVDPRKPSSAGRYPGLIQLAMRAGAFAGKQGLDPLAQEQGLWEWTARILHLSHGDAAARAHWRQAFLASYNEACPAPPPATDP